MEFRNIYDVTDNNYDVKVNYGNKSDVTNEWRPDHILCDSIIDVTVAVVQCAGGLFLRLIYESPMDYLWLEAV